MGAKVKKKKKNKTGTTALVIVLTAVLLGCTAAAWLYIAPRLTAASAPEATPTAAPTATPAPTAAPAPVYYPGYFSCDDGLFHPEGSLTLSAAAEALSQAMGEEIGFTGDGEQTMTEDTLTAFLEERFEPGRVSAAVEAIAGRGDETVTRAEAAVCFNRLLDLTGPGTEAVLPDVEPDYWAAGDVYTAASAPGPIAVQDGFFWVDGYLYCLGEDGYVLKNRYVGSLFFGPDGRYTSGSQELDGYVAQVILENTDDTMDRETRLRTVYEYCRDSFTYLRRNYYKVGDIGWQLNEALTMYSTGQGNCYCYASAFWAAARGLGYDAKIVSGLVNRNAPHGWVEILRDGERRTFDVELEMVLKDIRKRKDYSLYDMTDTERNKQVYTEQAASDNLVPRETNDGLLPR